MSGLQEMLRREAAYHDAISGRIEIDDVLIQKLLAFDSPASQMADLLPRLKRTLLQALGSVSGARVLVYGCGNDNAALWFAKSGANVDAIDISPKSVENQKSIAERASLKINTLLMDAHALDLPSDEYEVVYGNAILHHLDIGKAACEIRRVLKPGGKAVFRDVMRGNLLLQAFRLATPFWRTTDEHPLTTKDFALLADSFSECRISQYVLTALPCLFFARMVNNVILKKLGSKARISPPKWLCAGLDKADLALFRLMPALKKQAWICLVVLTK